MAKFGGNEFTSFSVPLVFAGRYFLLEPGSPPMLSVFVEVDGAPVFEVLRNEPGEGSLAEVTKTPPGIVTVSDKESGKFLYKVRPGSETSIAFGTLGGQEVTAEISDKAIKVGGITLQNNTFDGVMAGVVVEDSGSTSIGARLPPAVVKLLTQEP